MLPVAGFPPPREGPAPAPPGPPPASSRRCRRRRCCCGNGWLGGGRREGPPISRQALWSPTAPRQAPLSGWGPPRTIPFPISNPRCCLSVTSQQPPSILRALSLRVSSRLIGRRACPSPMCPAPPQSKDTSGSSWFDYTDACWTVSASAGSVTSPKPGTCPWRVGGWGCLPSREGGALLPWIPTPLSCPRASLCVLTVARGQVGPGSAQLLFPKRRSSGRRKWAERRHRLTSDVQGCPGGLSPLPCSLF